MSVGDRVVLRHVGPSTIVGLTAGYVVLWLVARPAGEQGAAYLGQLVGAVSVLLLSMALVLISSLPWVEEWFDGIDRAAVWHRRIAITGLLLLAVHIRCRPARFTPGTAARWEPSAPGGWWLWRCGRSFRGGSP